MKKRGKVLPAVVVISLLLLLGCVSVDAQGNNDYDEGVWTDQCKLNISKHQIDETFSANGVDKAKMDIMIEDKKTNNPIIAQSDIEVWLSSKNGIVKPREITISKGNAKSEAISLTSTQPGIASVIAEAAGFEAATTSVEFTPPSVPSGLLLDASPKENVLADGRHPTTLWVKLLNPDDEPLIPQVDRHIHISTNKGEKSQIIIYSGKPYGQRDFTTYKSGTVTITAKSPDFNNLEDSTVVTFISPITWLTFIVSALGGFLAGVFKYYREYKDRILIKPKKIDGTWRLGILGHSVFHSLFGTVIYLAASLNIPGTNVFNLPISIARGAFMIGLTGGLFFFAIISLWGLHIKRGA